MGVTQTSDDQLCVYVPVKQYFRQLRSARGPNVISRCNLRNIANNIQLVQIKREKDFNTVESYTRRLKTEVKCETDDEPREEKFKIRDCTVPFDCSLPLTGGKGKLETFDIKQEIISHEVNGNSSDNSIDGIGVKKKNVDDFQKSSLGEIMGQISATRLKEKYKRIRERTNKVMVRKFVKRVIRPNKQKIEATTKCRHHSRKSSRKKSHKKRRDLDKDILDSIAKSCTYEESSAMFDDQESYNVAPSVVLSSSPSAYESHAAVAADSNVVINCDRNVSDDKCDNIFNSELYNISDTVISLQAINESSRYESGSEGPSNIEEDNSRCSTADLNSNDPLPNETSSREDLYEPVSIMHASYNDNVTFGIDSVSEKQQSVNEVPNTTETIDNVQNDFLRQSENTSEDAGSTVDNCGDETRMISDISNSSCDNDTRSFTEVPNTNSESIVGLLSQQSENTVQDKASNVIEKTNTTHDLLKEQHEEIVSTKTRMYSGMSSSSVHETDSEVISKNDVTDPRPFNMTVNSNCEPIADGLLQSNDTPDNSESTDDIVDNCVNEMTTAVCLLTERRGSVSDETRINTDTSSNSDCRPNDLDAINKTYKNDLSSFNTTVVGEPPIVSSYPGLDQHRNGFIDNDNGMSDTSNANIGNIVHEKQPVVDCTPGVPDQTEGTNTGETHFNVNSIVSPAQSEIEKTSHNNDNAIVTNCLSVDEPKPVDKLCGFNASNVTSSEDLTCDNSDPNNRSVVDPLETQRSDDELYGVTKTNITTGSTAVVNNQDGNTVDINGAEEIDSSSGSVESTDLNANEQHTLKDCSNIDGEMNIEQNVNTEGTNENNERTFNNEDVNKSVVNNRLTENSAADDVSSFQQNVFSDSVDNESNLNSFHSSNESIVAEKVTNQSSPAKEFDVLETTTNSYAIKSTITTSCDVGSQSDSKDMPVVTEVLRVIESANDDTCRTVNNTDNYHEDINQRSSDDVVSVLTEMHRFPESEVMTEPEVCNGVMNKSKMVSKSTNTDIVTSVADNVPSNLSAVRSEPSVVVAAGVGVNSETNGVHTNTISNGTTTDSSSSLKEDHSRNNIVDNAVTDFSTSDVDVKVVLKQEYGDNPVPNESSDDTVNDDEIVFVCAFKKPNPGAATELDRRVFNKELTTSDTPSVVEKPSVAIPSLNGTGTIMSASPECDRITDRVSLNEPERQSQQSVKPAKQGSIIRPSRFLEMQNQIENRQIANKPPDVDQATSASNEEDDDVVFVATYITSDTIKKQNEEEVTTSAEQLDSERPSSSSAVTNAEPVLVSSPPVSSPVPNNKEKRPSKLVLTAPKLTLPDSMNFTRPLTLFDSMNPFNNITDDKKMELMNDKSFNFTSYRNNVLEERVKPNYSANRFSNIVCKNDDDFVDVPDCSSSSTTSQKMKPNHKGQIIEKLFLENNGECTVIISDSSDSENEEIPLKNVNMKRVDRKRKKPSDEMKHRDFNNENDAVLKHFEFVSNDGMTIDVLPEDVKRFRCNKTTIKKQKLIQETKLKFEELSIDNEESNAANVNAGNEYDSSIYVVNDNYNPEEMFILDNDLYNDLNRRYLESTPDSSDPCRNVTCESELTQRTPGEAFYEYPVYSADQQNFKSSIVPIQVTSGLNFNASTTNPQIQSINTGIITGTDGNQIFSVNPQTFLTANQAASAVTLTNAEGFIAPTANLGSLIIPLSGDNPTVTLNGVALSDAPEGIWIPDNQEYRIIQSDSISPGNILQGSEDILTDFLDTSQQNPANSGAAQCVLLDFSDLNRPSGSGNYSSKGKAQLPQNGTRPADSTAPTIAVLSVGPVRSRGSCTASY